VKLPRATHLVIIIAGKKHWLWHAVDQEGFVLDVLVQSRRDKKATKRLFRKLLKKPGRAPRLLITDKLKSYAAPKREIMPGVEHRQHKGLNNRVGNSHQPTRRRERIMKRFNPSSRIRPRKTGSVRSRASLYLRRRMDRVFLGDTHDVERNLSGPAAEGGRDNLVVTTAGTKEISEFTMLATEAARCVRALEAAHTSDPAFDGDCLEIGGAGAEAVVSRLISDRG
jgi:hypothetical protein